MSINPIVAWTRQFVLRSCVITRECPCLHVHLSLIGDVTVNTFFSALIHGNYLLLKHDMFYG